MIIKTIHNTTIYWTTNYLILDSVDRTSIPNSFRPFSIDKILSLSLYLSSSISLITDFPEAHAHAINNIGNSSIKEDIISPDRL